MELRSVDPSANPYLAMAVLLKAGLDGIKNEMKAPEPINRNIYAMSEKDRHENGIYDLPGTLHDALKYLAEDSTIKNGLGNTFMKTLPMLRELNGLRSVNKLRSGKETNI